MQLTTITTKGQVTIPSDVRALLGIQIGDKVTFTSIQKETREVTLRLIPKDVVSHLAGSLKSSVRESDHRKVREAAGRALGKKYQGT